MATLVRIPPLSYVHVLNTNTNVAQLVVGPRTLTCLDHEKVVFGPSKMIVVPPRCYTIIDNPVCRDGEGQVIEDKHGQAKLRHGEREIRFESVNPFPLYPGEVMKDGVKSMHIVEAESALRLKALRPFEDRIAGEEWWFVGPGTYVPRVEVDVVRKEKAITVSHNQALHLKASRDCKDYQGKDRKSGEEWLVRKIGSYLPLVDEEVVGLVNAVILKKDRTALHLRASKSFTDVYGIDRRAGDEWLVTYSSSTGKEEESLPGMEEGQDHPQICHSSSHIPDVYEEFVGTRDAIVLTPSEFVIIDDPMDLESGKPLLGKSKAIVGPTHFFLFPGEVLRSPGVTSAHLLGPGEALTVRGIEAFQEIQWKRSDDERKQHLIPHTEESRDRRGRVVIGEGDFRKVIGRGKGFAFWGLSDRIYSTSSLGDINGDGLADFAFATNAMSAPNGQITVVYGTNKTHTATDFPTSRAQINGTNGFHIDTSTTTPSVKGIGDFNGDSIDDFAVFESYEAINQNMGRVYVIFGNLSGFPLVFSVEVQYPNQWTPFLNGENGIQINGKVAYGEVW